MKEYEENTEGVSEASRYVKIMRLGVTAEEFLASEIGEYILGRVEDDERNAELEFRNVEPTDPVAVRNIQNKLTVCDAIRQYLRDAIDAGNIAQEMHDDLIN